MKKTLILIAMLLLVMMPEPARAERAVTVFAAASLQGALEAVVLASGASVVVSYGGSAAIARQVAQGAPADIVLLANTQWMDWLEAEGVLVAASRSDLLGNSLVVVGPKGAAPLDGADEIFARLGADGRLAMGQTTAVPAGIYGREWLVSAGVWEGLAPRLAESENVRAALAFVALGEAPLGITYASDAMAEPRVSVVYDVPQEGHTAIRYPVALVAQHNTQAAEFMDFLRSQVARDIFARHGFTRLGAP